MFSNLSLSLRKVAAWILVAGDVRLDNFKVFLEKFIAFLEEARPDWFSQEPVPESKVYQRIEKNLPLFMKDKALRSLESHLKDFPLFLQAGQAGLGFKNALYYLGKALSVITMSLYVKALKESRSEKAVSILSEIWGGHLGEGALMQDFIGKTNEAAIHTLLSKLKQTQKRLVPLISNKP